MNHLKEPIDELASHKEFSSSLWVHIGMFGQWRKLYGMFDSGGQWAMISGKHSCTSI